MKRSAVCLAFALVVVGASCASRTEVVLGAATDLQARGQIDQVQLIVSRDNVPVLKPPAWSLTDAPSGEFVLPGSFGVYSPDGNAVRLSIQLQGYKDAALVVERDSILSLVPNDTLFTRLTLVSDCSSLDGPSCPAGESCVEGVCRAQAVDAHVFPPYQKGDESSLECDSGIHYIITSKGAPMPLVTSGAHCPPGQTCQEGTCYKEPAAGSDGGVPTGAWVDTAPPSTRLLHAVWQTPDGNDVFAVGDAGTILHLSLAASGSAAATWQVEQSPVPANLFAVWGTSVDDVTAAGTDPGVGAVLIHRAGGVWSVVQSAPPASSLRALTGSGATDVWAAGVGEVAASPSPSGQSGAGLVPVVLHDSGGGFVRDPGFDAALAASTDPNLAATQLRGIAEGPGGELWIVGTHGVWGHFDGASWTLAELALPDGFAALPDLRAVVAIGPGEARFVGQNGFIGHVVAGTVTVEKTSTTADLQGLALRTVDELVAVGDFGTILRFDGTTWQSEASGTVAPLFAVFAQGGSTLEYAVGSDGTVRSFTVLPCSGDAQCQSDAYCNAQGNCVPRKTPGAACDLADHPGAASTCAQPGGCGGCPSDGFCTDGVCCNASPTTCRGCQACNVAGSVGTCAAVPSGQDPHGSCTGATGACQQTTCNGTGGCGISGGICQQPDCAGGLLTSYTCTDGSCTAITPPVKCPSVMACADAHDCASKCAADTDCDTTSYCDENGNCSPRKGANAQGTCDYATDCKNPASCRECQAGLTCVDGYCCQQATCGGVCQSCGVAGKQGTCSPVAAGGAAAHGSCPGAGTSCAETCNGTATASCSDSALNTTCGAAVCSTNTPVSVEKCGGGSCNAGTAGTSCTTTSKVCKAGACAPCTATSDCTAVGYSATTTQCAVGAGTTGSGLCLLKNGQACGSNSALCASGQCVDGFCCKSASCAGACNACGASGDCAPLAAGTAPNGHGGGCPSSNASCNARACNGTSTTCNYPTGSCGSASCSGDAPVSAGTCNQGTCGAGTVEATCSPYTCSGGSCTTTCTPTGGGCASDSTCIAHGSDSGTTYTCGRNQGDSCTSGAQCGTGICSVDGHCCDTNCAAYCDTTTNKIYPGATCASGTCVGTGTPTACAHGLTCADSDGCNTGCYLVWPNDGTSTPPFPGGSFSENCVDSGYYCDCVVSTPGGNCDGTQCCSGYTAGVGFTGCQ